MAWVVYSDSMKRVRTSTLFDIVEEIVDSVAFHEGERAMILDANVNSFRARMNS